MKLRPGNLYFEPKMTTLELNSVPFNDELFSFQLDLGFYANQIKNDMTFNEDIFIKSRIQGARLKANLLMKRLNPSNHETF